MLDIFVTHYKEPWEVGEKLFKMIDLQRCINFNDINVTIINDGGHRLPEECFGSLHYPVKQIDIPHGGISAARNAAIDNATEPWIMFCDFDDCYTHIFALRDILTALPDAQADMIWTRILAEDYVNGKSKLYLTPEVTKFVFTHGKVYRVQYLRDENIRFDTSLTFNEDSCFNNVIIARDHHSRIGELRTTMPVYTWIRRENSVTNSGREDEANYGHFRRNFIVTEENRKDPDGFAGMVTRTVFDTYYMLHSPEISLEMKGRMLEEFMPWIKERIDVFGKTTDDILPKIMAISAKELKHGDFPDDFQTVTDWVNNVVGIKA